MKKKKVLYSILIALVVILVVTDIFILNMHFLFRLSHRNRANLSSLNKIRTSTTNGYFDELAIPDDAKYYNLSYGLLSAGKKAEYNITYDQETIKVEVYCVILGKFYFTKEEAEFKKISDEYIPFSTYRVYDNISLAMGNNQADKELFLIVHTKDYEKVYDILMA